MGAAGSTKPWAQRTSRPFQAAGTNMAYCAPLLTPSCSSAAFGEWLATVTAGMPRSVRVRKQRPRGRFISFGLLADAAPLGARDVVLDARQASGISRQKIEM